MAKRPPTWKLPAIKLGNTPGVPLHRRLYIALRERILDGEFPKGARLPSSRALAKALGVSRNTVVNAYNKLADKNYLVARVGSGTSVAAAIPHSSDRNPLRTANVPRAVTGIAAILEQSHYPLRRAAFQDRDGNVLYIYDSRCTS